MLIKFVVAIVLSLVIFFFGLVSLAQAQLPLPEVLPSLDLRAPAPGRTAINTPDGGAIVAGDFRFIGGDTERLGIVKLRPDGSVDPIWQVTAEGVRALALDGDNLYLAGNFGFVNGSTRKGLAQVSLTTGVLGSWDPNSTSVSSYSFSALIVSAAKLYVGGNFTQIGTTIRTDLAKFDLASGALDASWNPGTDTGSVNAMVADATHLYIGGSFTQINSITRSRAAKIELASGVLDPNWMTAFNSTVLNLALEGSDLYAAGCFSTVNATNRSFFAKVSTAGAGGLNGWNAGTPIGCSNGVALSATHVYLSGIFAEVGGQAIPRFARVDKTLGAPDLIFQPNPTGGSFNNGSLVRPNGNVLAWGDFIQIGGAYSTGLAELSVTGALTSNVLWAEVRGHVRALAPAADGGTWVGGYFTRLGTEQRSHLLKLTSSGAFDATVNVSTDNAVLAIANSGSHVYVGGGFNRITNLNVNRTGLLRLSPSGVFDSTWNANANGGVEALKLLGPDDLYVGGYFNNIGGQNRNLVAKLSASTGLAGAWNSQITGNYILAIEADASAVYLGGFFNQVRGQARTNLAKVDSATGALDAAFAGNATGGDVRALLLGPSESLYVGGFFSSINGLGRPGFARLLTSSGAPDPSWNTFTPGGEIYNLAPSSDGLYITGSFSSIGNQSRQNVARLSHTGVVAPLFSPVFNVSPMFCALEQGQRVLVGGYQNYFAPATTRQIGLQAFARTATPQTTTLTITEDAPENSLPFQSYRVAINLSTTLLSAANQQVVIEDDFGATCSVFTDASGNGACELASRVAGARQLTARYAGTPLLLSSTDTETHTVSGTAVTPPVNTAFDLRSPTSQSSAKLSDGSVILGGGFTRIGDTPRRGLAKLLPDGTLDPNFSADVIGFVSQVLVDSTDHIYVIGSFGYIDGVLRRNFAKLDASGNVISGWSAAVTGSNGVRAALDANDDLVVQTFVSFVSGSPNFYRTNLVKLSSSSGALVPSFAVEVTTTSTTNFPQLSVFSAGTALYVLRAFDAVNSVARRNAVKLDLNGVVDSAWNPGPNARPEWLASDGAGGVYMAGSFTEVAGQTSINRLVRLNANGSLNSGFNAAPNSQVSEIIREGNSLWVSGFFSQIGGSNRFGLAKLDGTSGGTDSAFATSAGLGNTSLNNIVKTSSQVCGGIFAFDFTATTVRAMGRICRDASTGARVDTALVSRPAQVRALARQPDGTTLIGGFFARTGSTQQNLVRVDVAGVFDSNFAPSPANTVEALHVRGNGDIYVGGFPLTKLSPTGAVDTAFVANPNSNVRALNSAADGLLVGGFFTTINGQARTGVAKVDFATGAPIASWNPLLSANASVRALASDSTGNVYLGGGFSTVNGTARSNLAKLDSAGNLDSAWQANTNSSVASILAEGSAVYAGGFFGTIGGQTRNGPAKLDAVTGAVQAWNPSFGNTSGASMYALSKAQDGGILVGGFFNRIGGAYRSNAAKLDPITGLADAAWNPSFDSGVYAILPGYGGTPTRTPLRSVEQNIAIGGDFEFAGSTPMPGFIAVSSGGVQPDQFCSGFEDNSCSPLP